MSDERVTGGCLCGAVRYAADGPPSDVSYCHCRMCQLNFGNPFGVHAAFTDGQLRFTKGAPKVYRSSSFAQRGFCADCGTPLTFQYLAKPDRLSVSIGSLDHPERYAPTIHWAYESQVPWLHMDDGLPRKRNEEDPDFPGTTAPANSGHVA